MTEENKKWAAFITHNGHYEWKVMPFDLKNIPQIFQRKMDNTFRDDILVLSKRLNEHMEHLLILINKCQ